MAVMRREERRTGRRGLKAKVMQYRWTRIYVVYSNWQHDRAIFYVLHEEGTVPGEGDGKVPLVRSKYRPLIEVFS